MKLKHDDRAVAGQRAEFDSRIADMPLSDCVLLLAAVLERANPGEQHCDVVWEALARAEEALRSGRAVRHLTDVHGLLSYTV